MHGRCAKSEAATDFSVLVDLGFRRILEALLPAFLPVDIVFLLGRSSINNYTLSKTTVFLWDDLERNERKIAKELNRSVEEINDAIHAVKRAAPELQAGQRKNLEVMVDIKTGEVCPQIRKGKLAAFCPAVGVTSGGATAVARGVKALVRVH